jgi:DNA topoisomerase-1
MTIIERIQATGIRRIGSPKRGFHYRASNGSKITAADLNRIHELKIPPAWTEVAINSAPTGRVQALGKDGAGRWQYLYHETHVRQRDRKKFLRLIHFAQSLPALRAAIARDLRKDGLVRERVLAGILRILSMNFLRPGSEVYANENGSYGIATLRPRHVTLKGKTIQFNFRGKSGVENQSELRDRQLTVLMKELLRYSNRRVFKYENGGGKLVDVRASHINDYIREVMGEKFSAKDFRTWAGTMVCASALARDVNIENGLTSERKIVAAINETAEALRNTPAVCRSAYICPAVLSAFEKGTTINKYFESLEKLIGYRGVRLHPAEKALLRLLKKETG